MAPSNQKPSIPKGTRDFDAEQVMKRNFLRNTIIGVYEQFGFEPLETPAMEWLATLTGKYGAEGDQLLFRILKNGDYLRKVDKELLAKGKHQELTPYIAEKGLRYDLTVPFARYVAMNHHALPMPYRRYQVQPVWRGDRPQKGRYQEFWQCDADVVGSDSLLHELELVQIYDRVFKALGIKARVRINNRKLLNGVASLVKAHEFFGPICTAIDKMDKIGMEGVEEEFRKIGLTDEQVGELKEVLTLEGPGMLKLNELAERFAEGFIDPAGINEVRDVLGNVLQIGVEHVEVDFDLTLARGLSYYTGTIFEVVATEHDFGSLSGGGRYDNLTGVFGLEGVSGVGISFGLERLFDILEMQGWPIDFSRLGTRAIVMPFEVEGVQRALEVLKVLRDAGVKAELYTELDQKMGKKMKYADKKGIPFAVLIGSKELESGQVGLKDLASGEQQLLDLDALLERVERDQNPDPA